MKEGTMEIYPKNVGSFVNQELFVFRF